MVCGLRKQSQLLEKEGMKGRTNRMWRGLTAFFAATVVTAAEPTYVLTHAWTLEPLNSHRYRSGFPVVFFPLPLALQSGETFQQRVGGPLGLEFSVGRPFIWRSKRFELSFLASLVPTVSLLDQTNGLELITQATVAAKILLPAHVHFFVENRASAFLCSASGTENAGNRIANPAFENALTAGLGWDLPGRLAIRVPFYWRQKHFQHYSGAANSAQKEIWFGAAAEATLNLGPQTQWGIGYTLAQWGSWAGTVQSVFRIAL
jgi:hypothetical protein